MELFRKYSGRLMKIDTDANTQYKALIWFDYSLNLMNFLKEGDFIAIPSFEGENIFVILQIIKKLPIHFAMPQDLKGYPAFLTEAAKSAANDWIEQVDESFEDSTKIVCEAIPINKALVLKENPEIKETYSLPMPGKEARLLSYELMEKILNLNIKDGSTIGHLQNNENVKILIRIESLLRLHFGIFGFTGAGKSNLISSLIDSILKNSKEGTKIVIFDIMGEYLTLLIDVLVKYPLSKIIGIGRETFVNALYFNPELGAKTIVNTTLYPKRLYGYKEKFTPHINTLIQRGAFRVYETYREKKVGELFEEAGYSTSNIAADDRKELNLIRNKYYNKFGYEVADFIINELEKLNLKTNGEKFKKELLKLIKSPSFEINNKFFITLDEIIDELNSNKSGVYIIQSHDNNELKRFIKKLANEFYEDRRKSGKIFPLVSFILDEADEFIPQEAKGDSNESKQAIEMLARRGRKFGIGVGIATQRVVYLDTNIMAQPHTYFISKLPRVSDRERIAEAFAISEDTFEQTFKFQKGDWLLVSHDATGLEATPFPIHTPNAEDRIINFLK